VFTPQRFISKAMISENVNEAENVNLLIRPFTFFIENFDNGRMVFTFTRNTEFAGTNIQALEFVVNTIRTQAPEMNLTRERINRLRRCITRIMVINPRVNFLVIFWQPQENQFMVALSTPALREIIEFFDIAVNEGIEFEGIILDN